MASADATRWPRPPNQKGNGQRHAFRCRDVLRRLETPDGIGLAGAFWIVSAGSLLWSEDRYRMTLVIIHYISCLYLRFDLLLPI
jgi:hypothetical protein